MGAKVKNPRKKFLWQITFPKHPLNPYLFQNVQLPEISIEQVEHGDVNRSVKTAGRVSVGNLTAQKLETTSGSDTWLWDGSVLVKIIPLEVALLLRSTGKLAEWMNWLRMEFLFSTLGSARKFGLAESTVRNLIV